MEKHGGSESAHEHEERSVSSSLFSAHLGLNNLLQVIAVHEKSEHARDHPEGRLANHTHEWRNDGVQECISLELDSRTPLLGLYTAGRRLGEILACVEQRRVLNCVELLECRHNQGEQSQSLLG